MGSFWDIVFVFVGLLVGTSHVTSQQTSVCVKPIDLVLAFDASGSVEDAGFEQIKSFAKEIVSGFQIGKDKTHVGILTFSEYAEIHIRLADTFDKTELAEKIDNIPYSGYRTATDDALRVANTDMFSLAGGVRQGVPQVFILLTDGKCTVCKEPVENAVKPLKDKGVNIYTIGVTNNINKTELELISSAPIADHLFEVDTFDNLKSLVINLQKKGCSDKTGKCPVPNPPFFCNSRDEDTCYGDEQCSGLQKCCNDGCFNKCRYPLVNCLTAIDIAFALDASNSVLQETFENMKNFAKEIVDSFSVSQQEARFATLSYSEQASIGFNFVRYDSASEIKQAITNLQHTRGSTRVDRALELAKSDIFSLQGAVRTRRPMVLIVFFDGDVSRGMKDLAEVTEPLKVYGVNVVAIGVGPEINEYQLNKVASSSSSIFKGESFKDILPELYSIAKEACNEKSGTCKVDKAETPRSCAGVVHECSNDFECFGNAKCCKIGCKRTCKLPENVCKRKVDIAFALHQNLDQSEFERAKDFIKSSVNHFDIGVDKAHAAFMTFGNEAKVHFDFNSGQDFGGNLIRLIDAVPYNPGNGPVSDVLALSCDAIFCAAGGTRTNVPKMLVLITPSSSPSPQSEIDRRIGILRARGVDVLVVGIGDVNTKVLQPLTSLNPDLEDRVWLSKYAPGLLQYSQDIADFACGEAGTIFPPGGEIGGETDNSKCNQPKTCLKGPKGARGRPGAVGPVGLPGPPGLIGSKGLEGNKGGKGPDGRMGAKGRRGPDGIQGLPGFVGYDGIPGQQGVEGRRGNDGDCGLPGKSGDAGTPGLDGFDGPPGYPGLAGAKGEQGPPAVIDPNLKIFPGEKGDRGEDGRDGFKGVDGYDGTTGDRGDDGEDGKNGGDGLKGDMGDLGTYFRVKGAKGIRGERGRPGPKTVTGGGINSTEAVRGPKGEDGSKGQKGAIGETGIDNTKQGIKGRPGVTGMLGDIGDAGGEGPKGDRGMVGDNGAKAEDGDVGEAGPPGVSGRIGTKGDSGERGSDGKKGAVGDTGDSITGDKGTMGIIGDKGLPGSQGSIGQQGIVGRQGTPGGYQMGPSGDTGSVGLRGNRGKNGMAGEPGMIGVQGPKGVTGDPGARGDSGRNAELIVGKPGMDGPPGEGGLRGPIGDTGPTGRPGRNYVIKCAEPPCPRIKGKKGEPGSPGDTGLTGKEGLSGIKGAKGYPGGPCPTCPSGEQGTSGDVGGPGTPGQPGEPGVLGEPGDFGDQGPEGEDGLQGPEGEKGGKGPAGDIGPQGPKGKDASGRSLAKKGESGLPGDRGPDGNRGRQGAKGLFGVDGNPGPDGTRGKQGPKGEIGFTGARGTDGFPGTSGGKGDNGESGVGEAGYPGDDGRDGVQGSVGDIGEVGEKGAPGMKPTEEEITEMKNKMKGGDGSRGLQGDAGPIGPPGRRGPDGKRGPKGLPGPIGPKGQSAPKGDVGPPGRAGPDGDPGEGGFPGRMGLTGEPGDNGKPGPQGITPKGDIGEQGPKGASGEKGPDAPPPPGCINLDLTDIAYLIDNSRSVDITDFSKQKQFIKDILKEFTIGPLDTQAGIIRYGNQADISVYFNDHDNSGSLNKAINEIQYTAATETRLDLALKKASEELFNTANGARDFLNNRKVNKALVILGDGFISGGGIPSRIHNINSIKYAKTLRDLGVVIYSVAVGPEVNTDLLKTFVSKDSYFIQIDSYQDIISTVGGLRNRLSSQCITDGDPGRDGITGDRGEEGDQGPKGQPGEGKPGLDGFKGIKGDTGETFAERGVTGIQGTKGEAGFKGRSGRPGSVTFGPKGEKGEPGEKTISPKGPRGDEGERGLKGDPGPDGKSLCDNVLATDIVFLMDSSNSVGPDNFDKMKSFIKNIIRKFDIDNQLTRVSVITFDEEAQLRISLNQYNNLRLLNEALDNLPYMAGISTRMDKALIMAKQVAFTEQRGARAGVRKVLVLMADGLQSYAADQTGLDEAVKPLIDDKVLRYAIGIGQEISPEDLKIIADKNVILADNFDQLQLKIDDQIGLIGRSGCKGGQGLPGIPGKPGVDGAPGTPGQPGRRGAEGDRGPTGQLGPKGKQGDARGLGGKGDVGDIGDSGPAGLPACDQKENVPTDLGFMLDASGSLYSNGFEEEKKFIKAVINQVGEVSRSGINVGVVVYSDEARLEIRFNDFYNQDDLERAIDALSYDKKGTRIDLGLLESKKMFTTEFGGRGSSKKVLILLTDGQQSYVKDSQDPSEIAKSLGKDGIDIFSVGIGQEIDQVELESFITKPEHIFLATDVSTLIKDLAEDIAQALSCPGGPRGLDGAVGEDGPPGDQGRVGIKGRIGVKGFQGDPGLGPKGDTGSDGPQGRVGDKGEQGFRGPDGPEGIRGLRGTPGYPGAPGLKGQRGLQGFLGLDGGKGLPGPKGAKGDSDGIAQRGPRGPTGDKGVPGPIGDRGALAPGNTLKDLEGDRGVQGEPGDIGAKGESGKVKRPVGPSGNLGSPGPKGQPGVLGDNGDIGPKGEQGKKGIQGNVGRKGPYGDDGDNGLVGLDGTNGEPGLPGKSLRGDRGDPGPPGRDGKPGPDGEKGLPGFMGMVGKKGDDGEPGPRGPMRTSPPKPDSAMKGYKGSPGIDGDYGEKGQKGEATVVVGTQGRRGDNGDDGPRGPPGQVGDEGSLGKTGRSGPFGIKGRVGADGDPGNPGTPGPKGQPGEIIGGGDKGDKGDNGLQGPKGRPGKKGVFGDKGIQGPPGQRGIKGEKGKSGFPGLRGDQGPSGKRGTAGPNGKKGPVGDLGKPGQQGPPGHAEGFYIVRHSQNDNVPGCPRNYNKLWTGYSLMYTVGNGHSHAQDLGDAGSCVKSFSTLPFLFCSITDSCKYASRNDYVYWLSGDVRQPMMPVSSNAIEPFVSRCVVCEAPSVHIAVHSQDFLKPVCPQGFDPLWDGYSFMMVAGAGKTGAGQSLSSSGSCLEQFRPKPFIECQGARGTCHFFSDKYSFWLTTIDQTRQFQTEQPQTLSETKGDVLTSRVSKCKVCVRRLKKDAGESGNKPESNDDAGNQGNQPETNENGAGGFFSSFF